MRKLYGSILIICYLVIGARLCWLVLTHPGS
jgi:hypothetical protein